MRERRNKDILSLKDRYILNLDFVLNITLRLQKGNVDLINLQGLV